MSWRNDPDRGAIPNVGQGSVDLGHRTLVGEAVIYDGTDPDALIAFLGDSAIRNLAGELYQAAEDGVLTPMVKMRLPAIILKPPAGDWFTITDDQLLQEYAIHVNVPKPVDTHVDKLVDKKPPTIATAQVSDVKSVDKSVDKKAPAKKVAAKK